MSTATALKILPLIFLISFLLPQNINFGGDLYASIIAAEREAMYDQNCMKYGERPYFEEKACPEIEGVRWVYDGMKLSEIRGVYEQELLIDKLKFAVLGASIYFFILGAIVIVTRCNRALRKC